MNPFLAAIGWVSVSGTNDVVFHPEAFTRQILSPLTAAVAPCAALVVLWIMTGWVLRLIRMGSSARRNEWFDAKDDNCWFAREGGIYLPAEYGGAVAYGATVIDGERDVTVMSSQGEITMSRGQYERWMGLVDRGEVQGEERFG